MAKQDSKVTEEFPQEGTPEYEAFINAEAARAASTDVDTVKDRSVNIVTPDGVSVEMTLADLKEMGTADLLSTFGAQAAEDVLGSDQYGPILEDKGRLVGVPFVIVYWEKHEKGNFGSFVSMFIIDKNDNRYIVNDGSTGIRDQLERLSKESPTNGMIVCRNGFRVSDYMYTDPKTGDERPAKTYYIDTKLSA